VAPPDSSSSLKLTRRRMVGTVSRERRVGEVDKRDGLRRVGTFVYR
jgi:hypothetical protein